MSYRRRPRVRILGVAQTGSDVCASGNEASCSAAGVYFAPSSFSVSSASTRGFTGFSMNLLIGSQV